MSITTSDVFEFLESRTTGVIDRHEVAFEEFEDVGSRNRHH